MSHIMKISDIKLNPDNPRVISDENFEKLVNSIQEFPRMMELRPIIINAENTVLGGNMRLKAAIAAGLDSVYVVKALRLTPEQEKEFIIKDNLSAGDWDIPKLQDEWSAQSLQDWGLLVGQLKNTPDSVNTVTNEKTFEIIVTCAGEREQKRFFDELENRGFTCKLIG